MSKKYQVPKWYKKWKEETGPDFGECSEEFLPSDEVRERLVEASDDGGESVQCEITVRETGLVFTAYGSIDWRDGWDTFEYYGASGTDRYGKSVSMSYGDISFDRVEHIRVWKPCDPPVSPDGKPFFNGSFWQHSGTHGASEFGTCESCGRHWGHFAKSVRCVCGAGVSLT